MGKIALLVGLLLSTTLIAPAQEKAVIAVIPFQASGISEADAHGLTVLFEGPLHKTGRFTVVEQTRMESVLKAQETSLADCTDEACAVEIGKLLAAERIVLGTAGRIGQRYYLAVKLIDVAKGTNLNAQNEQRTSLDDLVDNLAGLAGRLSGLNDAQPPMTAAEASASSSTTVSAPKLTGSPFEMVLVKGGSYRMGAKYVAEPVHSVTVSSFYMGKYEVTQKQWVEAMGSNASYFEGVDKPVEQVSWFDAVDFCNRLSLKEGLRACYTIRGTDVTCDFTRNGYRLPTEAEWEFAARGGTASLAYRYAGSSDVNTVAWHMSNSGLTTHPVGTKQANELGIYDMSGNVWEWCWDWLGEYGSGSVQDPRGAASGSLRVLRGGSWYSGGVDPLGVTYRGFADAGYRYNNNGFRPARTAP